MDFRNWGEVTAVFLSIEVFLREKPSVVVIHPVSMKLKVHPGVFHNLYYIWEVKAMLSLIYHPCKPPGSAFHPAISHVVVNFRKVTIKLPFYLTTLHSLGKLDWPENC